MELPDADVSQRRMPKKEIVGRIDLADVRISHTCQKAWMLSMQADKGQTGGSSHTKQHGEQ